MHYRKRHERGLEARYEELRAAGQDDGASRGAEFRRFVASIDDLGEPGATPALHFIHTMLPHGPWLFDAAGRAYVTADRSKNVSYGALARGQAITHTVDAEAVQKAAQEFSVIGQSPLRMDGVEKVTGAAEYAGDIRLPGMLYARILRPPAHGATLTRVDTSGAAAIPGVTVVNQDGMVAVLHADPVPHPGGPHRPGPHAAGGR